jgi:hypothetical protein
MKEVIQDKKIITESNYINDSIYNLFSNLEGVGALTGGHIEYDGEMYLLDSDTLILSFKIDKNRLTIHKIEALQPGGGIGTSAIEQLHEYADDHSLEVWAMNVVDGSERYWESMGYNESSKCGEFYRV